MIVQTTATVTYTCYLDEEQARKVIEYAKENDCDLESAVWALQFGGSGLEIYTSSTESDFSTESIDYVELEEDDEEIYDEIMESENE